MLPALHQRDGGQEAQGRTRARGGHAGRDQGRVTVMTGRGCLNSQHIQAHRLQASTGRATLHGVGPSRAVAAGRWRLAGGTTQAGRVRRCTSAARMTTSGAHSRHPPLSRLCASTQGHPVLAAVVVYGGLGAGAPALPHCSRRGRPSVCQALPQHTCPSASVPYLAQSRRHPTGEPGPQPPRMM